MDYYTCDTSLGQTILSDFLHGFHSPGMKKAHSPFPHSSRNRNRDSSFSPFLEEDNFMRNWEFKLWLQDNELLHFRYFLGPDHLVQFSAWLPFAPYLSSLEILLGFSEFNLLPSLLGLNLAQLMFKVSLPENALCWGLLYMFFPLKIMDVLQAEKFQGQAYEIGLDFLLWT